VKIKKSFLIYPPTGLYMRDDRCQAPVKGMTAQPMRAPLDLAYMAATLEGVGVECLIRDYPAEGMTWPDLYEDLRNFDPDMLVISVTTPTLIADLKACGMAKDFKKQILTVSKGAHFLVEDENVFLKFPDLDIIIRGESEFTVREIVTAKGPEDILGISYKKDGGIRRNPDRPLLEDLDKLPFPARHLLNNDLYLTPDTKEALTLIYAGRGCPYKCIFCAVPPVSGHKIKLRSPESIVGEIEECVKKYNIKNFFFRADTFTWDEDWVIEICRLIIEKRLPVRWGTNSRVDTVSDKRLGWMKRAGCWIIGFGVESGDQSSLDRMKKKAKVEDAFRAVSLCKKYGIKTYTLFVIGFPWDTEQTINDTATFIKTLDPDYIDINIAYPLPGTELFEIAKKEALFNEEAMYGCDYSKPLIRTRSLDTKELVRLRKKALLGFYLRFNFIVRTLLSVRSLRVFLSYLGAGIGLIFKLSNAKLNVEDFRQDL